MEERIPPPDEDDRPYHRQAYSSKEDDDFDDYYSINNNNNYRHFARKDNNSKVVDDAEMQIIPSKKDNSSDQQQRPHSTYIIQVPKDQIYRVPPPENAQIVERYRNPVESNNKGRRRCLYWCLSVFLVVAFIISVIVAVHHFTLKPQNPTFAIKHVVVVKRPTPPSKKNHASPPPPGFKVSLETRNPNMVNDIGYGQGSATLEYKGKEIGRGSFAGLENEQSGKSDLVDVVLSGSSKGKLPKEFESQLRNNNNNNNNKKKPLKMSLSMNVPLKLKTWLFTKKLNAEVGCNFELNSLGDNIKVLLQKCDLHK